MDWIETLVVVLHVVIAVALVGLVLIQHGKGANAGAAFGGGASQTVFGSEGSSSFLVRATTLLAIIFFVTSFSLAVFAKQRAEVAGEAGIPVVEESSSDAGQAESEAADEGEDGRGDENELPELE
ncbi:preprotein translocase subunit SecG [Marinobacter sp. HL-58]|uniref:preprotein translocase subunit SecG n=1 Tax=Marinobacter sp. HL-58 TaxID=1479237 RepID=UPI00048260D0|nr:preprotein translocase subunit SecG [Marinobacter sp. HL-58]KPQ03094.1 MAG: preprotein translocase subunit SecG [Marinobacter sp. HL-58]